MASDIAEVASRMAEAFSHCRGLIAAATKPTLLRIFDPYEKSWRRSSRVGTEVVLLFG